MTAWQGATLLPDGDIVFKFQEKSFPYGGGLVRLGKDSKVVWAVPRNTHHDVHLADDGTFWVPSMHWPDGLPGIRAHYGTPCSMSAATARCSARSRCSRRSKSYRAALAPTTPKASRVASNDPLHLNAAETLPAAWASAFPLFAPGEPARLLAQHQHHRRDRPGDGARQVGPQRAVRQAATPTSCNGHILLFDNRGGDPACGGSQILEIDPVSQKIVWSYDGCGGPPFDTGIRGMQQALPNGNVLVTETMRGRVFEVTRDSPARIVWDYRNALGEVEGQARLGVVTHAERIPREALTFLAATLLLSRRLTHSTRRGTTQSGPAA